MQRMNGNIIGMWKSHTCFDCQLYWETNFELMRPRPLRYLFSWACSMPSMSLFLRRYFLSFYTCKWLQHVCKKLSLSSCKCWRLLEQFDQSSTEIFFIRFIFRIGEEQGNTGSCKKYYTVFTKISRIEIQNAAEWSCQNMHCNM